MNNATAGVKSVITNRPAETATGLTAAVVAVLVASWTAVLSAESGTNAAKKKAADPPAGDPPAH
jgi:hypothetical protein